jgi:hypothetical protein
MFFYRNRVYPHIVTVLGNPKPVQKICHDLLVVFAAVEVVRFPRSLL